MSSRTGVYLDDFLTEFKPFPFELQRVLALILDLEQRLNTLQQETKEKMKICLDLMTRVSGKLKKLNAGTSAVYGRSLKKVKLIDGATGLMADDKEEEGALSGKLQDDGKSQDRNLFNIEVDSENDDKIISEFPRTPGRAAGKEKTGGQPSSASANRKSYATTSSDVDSEPSNLNDPRGKAQQQRIGSVKEEAEEFVSGSTVPISRELWVNKAPEWELQLSVQKLRAEIDANHEQQLGFAAEKLLLSQQASEMLHAHVQRMNELLELFDTEYRTNTLH